MINQLLKLEKKQCVRQEKCPHIKTEQRKWYAPDGTCYKIKICCNCEKITEVKKEG